MWNIHAHKSDQQQSRNWRGQLRRYSKDEICKRREGEITKEEYEANLKLLQAYNPRDHHRGIVTLSNRKQALVSISQQKKTIWNICQKRSLTWSLFSQATMPTRIRPTIKLPFVLKYCSDQSQTARHRKTTAKSPTICAHLSLLFWFLVSFGWVIPTTSMYLSTITIFVRY